MMMGLTAVYQKFASPSSIFSSSFFFFGPRSRRPRPKRAHVHRVEKRAHTSEKRKPTKWKEEPTLVGRRTYPENKPWHARLPTNWANPFLSCFPSSLKSCFTPLLRSQSNWFSSAKYFILQPFISVWIVKHCFSFPPNMIPIFWPVSKSFHCTLSIEEPIQIISSKSDYHIGHILGIFAPFSTDKMLWYSYFFLKMNILSWQRTSWKTPKTINLSKPSHCIPCRNSLREVWWLTDLARPFSK